MSRFGALVVLKVVLMASLLLGRTEQCVPGLSAENWKCLTNL
jgi:hypothetical protein